MNISASLDFPHRFCYNKNVENRTVATYIDHIMFVKLSLHKTVSHLLPQTAHFFFLSFLSQI